MRKLIMLAGMVALAGCQSTIPLPQDWDEYSYNDRLNKIKTNVEPKMLLGEPQGMMAMAIYYSKQKSQIERQKAVPIYQELVERKNKDAIILYAIETIDGTYGIASDDVYLQHRDFIKAQDPALDIKYTQNKQKWEKVYSDKFAQLVDFYNDAMPLCEQPLKDTPQSLSKTTDRLIPTYINHCLLSHSYNEETVKARLLAAAKYQALSCNDASKVCMSQGYRALANNNLGDDKKSRYATAIAVRNLYKKHSNSFKLYADKYSGIYLSPKASSALSSALDYSGEDNYEKAVQVLETALNQPKMTRYDKAYLNQILALMWGNKVKNFDDPNDVKKVINYQEKALAANILGPVDTRKLEIQLAQLYFASEDTDKYLSLMASLFQQNDEISVIPQETLNAMLALNKQQADSDIAAAQ
ncbi:hypothetical protein [Thalassotalea agarivorans]|uniref:Uncharacterized protein n=1 Tax=Thalassotalea agarivorans TaxID=349064 RepID=A0A1I0G6P0_THASX|nr:hypothetical protein [Thalassotalea agarivorans]SET66599.1 hypothetical protein SAMN05660429_02340 [Thalassotalea agarivorans]